MVVPGVLGAPLGAPSVHHCFFSLFAFNALLLVVFFVLIGCLILIWFVLRNKMIIQNELKQI